jgi:hypothetical protein
MKNLLIIFFSFSITFFLNYVLFVPASPVNLMLSLINDDINFHILMDTFLSNVIFFTVFSVLKIILTSKFD